MIARATDGVFEHVAFGNCYGGAHCHQSYLHDCQRVTYEAACFRAWNFGNSLTIGGCEMLRSSSVVDCATFVNTECRNTGVYLFYDHQSGKVGSNHADRLSDNVVIGYGIGIGMCDRSHERGTTIMHCAVAEYGAKLYANTLHR